MVELSLNAIYVAMLNSMFMHVSEDDIIHYGLGSMEPVTINGQEAVMPTDAKLDSKKYENAFFFHPLCEDALYGQSAAIHFLTRRALAALSLRTDSIVGNLLQLAGDGSKQSKIKNAEALKFLKIAKGVNNNSVAAWNRLVEHMSENTGLFAAYLNRNVEIDGTHYSRVCVLDVPALRDTQPGADLCGVNVLSKANKVLLRGILEQIFEGVQLEYGSNHAVPYLHCLLTMYKTVSERLNHIITMFKGALDCVKVGFDWYDELFGERFDTYHGMIPVLSGNTGEDIRGSIKSVEEKAGRDVESPPFDPDPRPVRTGTGISLKDLDDADRGRDRDRRDRDRDRDRDRGRDRDRDRRSSYDEFANSDRPRSERDRDRDRDRDGGRRSRLRDAFNDRDDSRRSRDKRDREDDRDRDRRRGGGGIRLEDLD